MTAIERPGPAGPSAPPDENMVFVPGGTFCMGSEDFYPEERPVHRVAVDGFWMDRHPVTVAQFRRFVKATGYRTLAERAPDAADYPGADPAMLVPGALVFHPTRGPVDLGDVANWWQWVPGARWDRPEGPGSDTYTRARHPVVHVAPSRPPRAARSHSASVGSALPAQAAYASASSCATWTTGCRARVYVSLPGPSGRSPRAPGTQFHQFETSPRSTGPRVGRKTSAPGTSSAGSAPG